MARHHHTAASDPPREDGRLEQRPRLQSAVPPAELPHVLHAEADPESHGTRRALRRFRPHVLDVLQPVVGRSPVCGRRDAGPFHGRAAVREAGPCSRPGMGLQLEPGRDLDRPGDRERLRATVVHPGPARHARSGEVPEPGRVPDRPRSNGFRRSSTGSTASTSLGSCTRRPPSGGSARASRNASTDRSTRTS